MYKGVYDSPSGIQEDVAIKTLQETHSEATKQEFLREARLMTSLDHHCVVKLIGLSEGPPLLMVIFNFYISKCFIFYFMFFYNL